MGGYTGVLGPVLLSIFINTYLSGLVGFQYALFQALKYKKSLCIRFTVLLMYAIDVFQIVIAFYMIWIYCVTHYIDPQALGNAVLWIFATIPLCSTISSFIAHAFMIYRISLFTKRRVPLNTIAVLSSVVLLLGLAVGLYGIARDVSMMDVVADTSSYRSLLLSWLVARLALDSVILGTMSCIYLRQEQNFLNHIQSRIVRIGLIGIQCGYLTTLFSICTLITFLASPKTTIYVAFLLPSGRLYTNVVLSTVNSLQGSEDQRQSKSTNVLTKDMWAVSRTKRTTHAQSIGLNQIGSEQEAIIGSQSGDVMSISSHPTFKHDEKKSGDLLQPSNGNGNDNENLE